MMTSRAENRIILRQDNADMRLTEIGRSIGLISDGQYDRFLERVRECDEIRHVLTTTLLKCDERCIRLMESVGESVPRGSLTAAEMLRRPPVTLEAFMREYVLLDGYSITNTRYVVNELKYEGYIQKERSEIQKSLKLESKAIPEDIDYNALTGLRLEAREKLSRIRPVNLGQAARISGVSPADVTVLLIYLGK